MRKRKPETIEIQQIKQQAKEERLLRELEQARLNKETEAREMAEAKQREYEEKLEEMRQSMELKEREIEQAYFQIRELEQQLIELNKVSLCNDITILFFRPKRNCSARKLN
jgi:radixin